VKNRNTNKKWTSKCRLAFGRSPIKKRSLNPSTRTWSTKAQRRLRWHLSDVTSVPQRRVLLRGIHHKVQVHCEANDCTSPVPDASLALHQLKRLPVASTRHTVNFRTENNIFYLQKLKWGIFISLYFYGEQSVEATTITQKIIW